MCLDNVDIKVDINVDINIVKIKMCTLKKGRPFEGVADSTWDAHYKQYTTNLSLGGVLIKLGAILVNYGTPKPHLHSKYKQ